MCSVTSKQSGCLPPTGQLHAVIERWDAEHGDEIIRFMQVLGLPLYDAEDAKQETLRKAYQWLSKGGKPESDKGLLLTIAKNIAMDFHRKVNREGGPWAELDASAVISTGVDPLTESCRGELSEALNAAIERLTLPQQQVIRRHFYAGKSQAEIARSRGISEAAVARLLVRAINNLRKQLSGFMAAV